MVSAGSTSNTLPSWPRWRVVLTGLCALALALSTYLSWHYLAGGPVIGCGGGSSCDQVLSSRWSTLGGIVPVSGLAMGTYLAMLMASLFIGPGIETPVRRLAWGAMLILSGAAAGSAVWFVILQEWFIDAFCPYCMTAHMIGLVLTALVIWQAPDQPGDTADHTIRKKSPSAKGAVPSVSKHLISRRQSVGLASIGLILSAVMAFTQVSITPSTVYVDGESREPMLVMDPHDVPLVGSPDASYMVTLLFDYQCTHCQQLHFMLDQAIRRYDGNLAFMLCPSPLSSECNPNIPSDTDESNISCDLARIGMAVWLADREAFTVFNRWMFTLESGDHWLPRSLDATYTKAVELIGQDMLDAAMDDPWVDRYIQTIVRTYAQTGVAVPKLVYGSRWVIPQPHGVDDLLAILQNSLELPAP